MDDNREKLLLKRQINHITSKLLQLQKANAWWSNCAGVWRKRWMLTRNQRNQLRSEVKHIWMKNEAISLECTKLKETNILLNQELEKMNVLKKLTRIEESFENVKSDVMYNKLQSISPEEKSQNNEFPTEYTDNNKFSTEKDNFRNDLKFQKIKTFLLAYCDQHSLIKSENETLRNLCSQILKMVDCQNKLKIKTSLDAIYNNSLRDKDKSFHNWIQKDYLPDHSQKLLQEDNYHKWLQKDNFNDWFIRRQSKYEVSTRKLFSPCNHLDDEICNENVDHIINAQTSSTYNFNEEIDQSSDGEIHLQKRSDGQIDLQKGSDGQIHLQKNKQVETDIGLRSLTKSLEEIIYQNERLQDELKSASSTKD